MQTLVVQNVSLFTTPHEPTTNFNVIFSVQAATGIANILGGSSSTSQGNGSTKVPGGPGILKDKTKIRRMFDLNTKPKLISATLEEQDDNLIAVVDMIVECKIEKKETYCEYEKQTKRVFEMAGFPYDISNTADFKILISPVAGLGDSDVYVKLKFKIH